MGNGDLVTAQPLILRHNEVVSTMDAARAALQCGTPAPFWLVADSQTGGRGRHGRAWLSPPGNLHVTLALSEPCVPARSPELAFVAGLALHGAVQQACGAAMVSLALKWPNDLLLGGAKVAGLLLEGLRLEERFCVLVGFGINLVEAPPDTPYPATALARHGEAPARDAMLAALTQSWERQWQLWQHEGFSTLRLAWLSVAAGLGQPARVRLADRDVRGIMRDLDAHGRLLLETPHGLVRIDAGDLFFGD